METLMTELEKWKVFQDYPACLVALYQIIQEKKNRTKKKSLNHYIVNLLCLLSGALFAYKNNIV